MALPSLFTESLNDILCSIEILHNRMIVDCYCGICKRSSYSYQFRNCFMLLHSKVDGLIISIWVTHCINLSYLKHVVRMKNKDYGFFCKSNVLTTVLVTCEIDRFIKEDEQCS